MALSTTALSRFITVIAMFGAGPTLGQLAVTSTQPLINANNVSAASPIVVNFDRPVDTTTFTPGDFHVFARWMGRVNGSLAFSNNDTTATFTPTGPFAAGDVVTVFMSHDLRAADGSFLRQAGYTLMFTVGAAPSAGTFCHKTTFSDRTTSGGTTRIYGGLACDLNLDGAPDLTLINEVSGDLRTYLNRNDGSGLFQPMLAPTSIPFESSPNEPADFNGDGFVDIVTSSNLTNQVTVAFGTGTGAWGSPTIINTGAYPRGIAILDHDGDGDMDMVVSIRNTDSVSIFTNNGAGVFAAPVNMFSGGDGPYGIAAADMNNDGILDLVVGHTFSQTCVVLRGNGNGTFTQVSTRSLGGTNWVIACGDVNNDRFMDVSTANAGSSNGSILKGNGDGTLQAAAVMSNGGHTTGTDLMDIEGDGDLDWLISAYGASRWYLYRNNGTGTFSLLREFEAPGNPACSVSADFDRDGDIDLILLDETTDLCLVMINSPAACYANCDCSNGPPALTANDFQCFLNKYASQDPTANCDGVGGINANDFTCFLNEYANGCGR
jgi:hypothetical protein